MSDLPRGAAPGRAQDRSVEDFNALYGGTPPWEVGHPQPVFVSLADAGRITGRVLDAGCGTGENALMLADRGLEVTGIDAASAAIAAAQDKTAARALSVHFQVGDALRLGELGQQFDSVIDSALFHVFDDERRALYVRSLASVLLPGGRLFLCCFSDLEPGDWGPRRVHEDEFRATFAEGWAIESIERDRYSTAVETGQAHALVMVATRT